MKYVALLAILTLPMLLCSQQAEFLYADAYLQQVQTQHPMAVQAALQRQIGDAAVLSARGAFDPAAYTNYNRKHFKATDYYSLLDGGLKMPTWFGLEAKAGYEQTQGIYLNPEQNTPTGGLIYAGLTMPLGQGLFIDQRRAGLRMAQVFQESTRATQLSMLNDLLFEAGYAYWKWFLAYHSVQVFENTLELANERLEAVKQSARIGELPAIDTVEAGIQVQNLQLNLQQAQLEYQNARELIAVFLWENGQIPLELDENTSPPPLDEVFPAEIDPVLLSNFSAILGAHPELQRYRFKIDELEIDQRWKREQLKPTLNLTYNLLNEPIFGETWGTFSPNNYKLGVEFNMPLFLRRERGNLQLSNLKIQETELELTNKNAQLAYKAIAALNTWQQSAQQLNLYAQTVQDLGRLLEGERQLFQVGESSLFLVNAREISFVNAQVKYIELLSKNQSAGLETSYALGILAGNSVD